MSYDPNKNNPQDPHRKDDTHKHPQPDNKGYGQQQPGQKQQKNDTDKNKKPW